MRKTPKDFTFRKQSQQLLVKLPGQVQGNGFSLDRLEGCKVYLLDHTSQVIIDDCGPCSGSVFLRDCTRCTLCVAAREFRTRDCTDCSISLYSLTQPCIETSSRLVFSPWRGAYPGAGQHFTAAKLEPAANLWDQVFDFNDGEEVNGSLDHWSLNHDPQPLWIPPLAISGNTILPGEPENPVTGSNIDYTRTEPVRLLPCPMLDQPQLQHTQQDSAATPRKDVSSTATALTRPTYAAAEPASASDTSPARAARDWSDLEKPMYGALVQDAVLAAGTTSRTTPPADIPSSSRADITVRSRRGHGDGAATAEAGSQAGPQDMRSTDQDRADVSRSLHGVGRAVVSQAAPLPPPSSSQVHRLTDPREVWRSQNRQRLRKQVEDEAAAKLAARNRAKDILEQRSKERAARIWARHGSLTASGTVGNAAIPASSGLLHDVGGSLSVKAGAGWPAVHALISCIKVDRSPSLCASSTGRSVGVAGVLRPVEGRVDRMMQVIERMCEHA